MDKIAILTSGGDASGMNATIAYLTKYAIAKQLEVFYVKTVIMACITTILSPVRNLI